MTRTIQGKICIISKEKEGSENLPLLERYESALQFVEGTEDKEIRRNAKVMGISLQHITSEILTVSTSMSNSEWFKNCKFDKITKADGTEVTEPKEISAILGL